MECNENTSVLLRCFLYLDIVELLQRGTILLQSRTAITKWDDFITKWDGYYKVGQIYYKVGQLSLLQSGSAFVITKWDDFLTKWDGYYKVGRFYYKVGQVLQSGTIITKWALTPCLSYAHILHCSISFSKLKLPVFVLVRNQLIIPVFSSFV